MRIYFFDTETTGNTPDDRIVQLAVKEQANSTPIINELFKPPMSIPFESSAVHHISNKMVVGKPSFQESSRYKEIKELFENPENLFVAHNSAFDVAMLETENIKTKNIICTLKNIRSIDTAGEFTNHRLQYLRYALNMELDVGAHDALADVIVLEQLFEYLLKKMIESDLSEKESLDKMQKITSEPSFIREFGFGKHKGMRIEEVAKVDPGYLSWLLTEKLKNPIGEEDWIFTLKKFVGQ